MVDAMLRSIYSAADETIAQLDLLHQSNRNRALTARQALDATVARLGESSVPFMEPDDPQPPYGSARERSHPTATEPSLPFVPLPRRTTHGGDWGPAMRAKLTAEALAKGGRW
jgi:hypothetical protein